MFFLYYGSSRREQALNVASRGKKLPKPIIQKRTVEKFMKKYGVQHQTSTLGRLVLTRKANPKMQKNEINICKYF